MEATPIADQVAVLASFRALRDSRRGWKTEDLPFINCFIDKIIKVLDKMRCERNLGGAALAYVRRTIKTYQDVKRTYTERRRPRQKNGKAQGDNWVKRPQDKSYKPSRVPQRGDRLVLKRRPVSDSTS